MNNICKKWLNSNETAMFIFDVVIGRVTFLLFGSKDSRNPWLLHHGVF